MEIAGPRLAVHRPDDDTPEDPGRLEKIKQEFYCRHCPADDDTSDDPEARRTGGHFFVLLSPGYNATVHVRCPRCDHEHVRHVAEGTLRDGPKGEVVDRLRAPRSSWSRLPRTRRASAILAAKPQDHWHPELRGGVVVDSAADLVAPEPPPRRPYDFSTFVGERRLELHGPDVQ